MQRASLHRGKQGLLELLRPPPAPLSLALVLRPRRLSRVDVFAKLTSVQYSTTISLSNDLLFPSRAVLWVVRRPIPMTHHYHTTMTHHLYGLCAVPSHVMRWLGGLMAALPHTDHCAALHTPLHVRPTQATRIGTTSRSLRRLSSTTPPKQLDLHHGRRRTCVSAVGAGESTLVASSLAAQTNAALTCRGPAAGWWAPPTLPHCARTLRALRALRALPHRGRLLGSKIRGTTSAWRSRVAG